MSLIREREKKTYVERERVSERVGNLSLVFVIYTLFEFGVGLLICI